MKEAMEQKEATVEEGSLLESSKKQLLKIVPELERVLPLLSDLPPEMQNNILDDLIKSKKEGMSKDELIDRIFRLVDASRHMLHINDDFSDKNLASKLTSDQIDMKARTINNTIAVSDYVDKEEKLIQKEELSRNKRIQKKYKN